MAVVAALLLSAWAWRQLGRTPQVPAASAANCSQEAIRAVSDPVARSILASRCAKRADHSEQK
ncbi:hypothetical protein ASF61_08360 [Duganella sp. Leaf126]|nr:hypothetical protein ASF61_08360 [Duganella sp. Leaf126]